MHRHLYRGLTKTHNIPVQGYLLICEGRYYLGQSLLEYTLIDPKSLQQCTGLTDMNGELIFEGDKLDVSQCQWDAFGPAGYPEPVVTVEYDESTCGFTPFCNYDCDCGISYCAKDVRIIK